MMKKKGSALMLLWMYSLCAKPPLEDMRGFDEAYGSAFLHLSPVRGQYAIESSWVKTFYLIGDDQCPMHKLVRALFYVGAGGELYSTIYKPYKNFSPKVIAILVAALELGLFDLFGASDENIDTTIGVLQRNKCCGNERRMREFLEKLALAQQIENVCYPAHTTQRILLAFLYQKADKRKTLLAYVKQLRKRFGEIPLPRFVRNGLWNDSDAQWFTEWKMLLAEDPSCPSLTILNGPRIAYGLLASQAMYDVYSPEVIWLHEVNFEDMLGVSDCCETALRNLCNNLLYDPQTKSFDSNRLPDWAPAKAFYKNHASARYDQSNAREVHEAWLPLLANVPKVVYRQQEKHYEVAPSLRNFIKLLRHIVALPKVSSNLETTSKRTAEKIKDSAKELEEILNIIPGISARLIDKSRRNDNDQDVTFDIMHMGTQGPSRIQRVSLHIKPDHAWLSHDNYSRNYEVFEQMWKKEKPLTAEGDLVKKLLDEKLLDKRLALPGHIKDLALLYAPAYPVYRISDTKNVWKRLLLFAHPMELETQKFQLFKRLISAAYKEDKGAECKGLNICAINVVNALRDSIFVRQALIELIDYRKHRSPLVQDLIPRRWRDLEIWDKQKVVLALARTFSFDCQEYCDLCCDFLKNVPENSLSGDGLQSPRIGEEILQSPRVNNTLYVLLELFRYHADETVPISHSMGNMITGLSSEQRSTLTQKYTQLACLGNFPVSRPK
jgi:hypothetical protein